MPDSREDRDQRRPHQESLDEGLGDVACAHFRGDAPPRPETEGQSREDHRHIANSRSHVVELAIGLGRFKNARGHIGAKRHTYFRKPRANIGQVGPHVHQIALGHIAFGDNQAQTFGNPAHIDHNQAFGTAFGNHRVRDLGADAALDDNGLHEEPCGHQKKRRHCREERHRFSVVPGE
jgi:hypothetical protein